MNKGQAGNPPQFPLPPFPPDGDDKGGKDDKSKMEAYRFDSAALERAAKAAKDLESTSKKKKIENIFYSHFIWSWQFKRIFMDDVMNVLDFELRKERLFIL